MLASEGERESVLFNPYKPGVPIVVFVTLPTPIVDMNQSQGRLRPSLLL